jgi:3'-5' exoribonuclease
MTNSYLESTSATNPKNLFIRDLQDKMNVASLFLVRDKALLTGKTGKSYISFTLSDSSGAVDAKVWEGAEALSESFQDGDVVTVKANVQVYQNRKQLIVQKIERIVPDLPGLVLTDFIAKSRREPEEMMAELLMIAETIQDVHIKQVVLETLHDPEIRSRLLRAPAAKTIHHAWVGGLLDHIISICGLMKFIAKHYADQGSDLNADLLLFGAIFHDIGKIWELDPPPEGHVGGIVYTDKGRLLGHMMMAVELVEKRASRVLGFPEELKDLLKHIIISHHGKIEFGSLKTPAFLEAHIVAAIDDLDSKISSIDQLIRGERNSGQRWSKFSPLYERHFLLTSLAAKDV